MVDVRLADIHIVMYYTSKIIDRGTLVCRVAGQV